MEQRRWEYLAYAARYGATPPAQGLGMTYPDMRKFCAALSKILREEAESGKTSSQE